MRIVQRKRCTTFSRPLNQPFIRIIQIKFPIYIFSALDCECCFARLKFQKTKHHVDTEKNQRLKAKCTAEFVLRKQTNSIISWKKKLFILWSTQRAKITHGYNKFRRNNLDEIYMLCSSLNLAPEGTNEEKKKTHDKLWYYNDWKWHRLPLSTIYFAVSCKKRFACSGFGRIILLWFYPWPF